MKGRTTWYETVEEMQADLDAYLEIYNTRRPHRGRGMNGKPPAHAFKAGIKLAKKAAKTPTKKEKKTAA